MARRPKPKYQLPRTRRSPGAGRWLWLLAPLLLVLVLWVWWTQFHQKNTVVQPVAPPPARPVQVVKPPLVTAPATAVVVPRTVPVAPVQQAPVAPPPPVVVAPAAAPLPAVTPPAVEPPSVVSPPSGGFPRPVTSLLEAQVALARRAISPGSIDGAMGSQTRLALREFQGRNHLPATGVLDPPTRALITLESPPLTVYTVTADDLGRLQPLGKTWLEKSRQTALDFESELELVGEFSHANPALIRQLNPGVDWAALAAGATLQVPAVRYPEPSDKAAVVVIHLGGKYLEALDDGSNLLAHFPCSIAARVEKRPVGSLRVVVVAPHPNYTFDPAVFPESPEAQRLGRKLVLPSGPNNPVGVAWLGLDRPGYGIHGTPAPEQVGRTESHGCFRLANWDAAYLLQLAWVGLPVEVVP